ncbi:MAG: hypothetical protein HQ546_02100, partial [Planctomycetes bacterium]|nr:hypothetical protein [Planctomycetota bacterium]
MPETRMSYPIVAAVILMAMAYLPACSISSAAVRREVAFYVSVAGNDAWSGRLARPASSGKDGPFATLEAARDAVRKLRKTDSLPGGAVVYLCGGMFLREKAFLLTAEDAGTAGAPIIYRSLPGEQAVLVGGRQVKGWQKVKDRAVLARLSKAKAARANVYQVNLKALGIVDYGQLKSRGFSRPTTPSALELFYNDQPMTLARWPNKGFVHIASIPNGRPGYERNNRRIGKLEDGFCYSGDRPRSWKDVSDIWVNGYWVRDWANS